MSLYDLTSLRELLLAAQQALRNNTLSPPSQSFYIFCTDIHSLTSSAKILLVIFLYFYILFVWIFLSYDGGCGFRHRLNKSLKKAWPCVEVEQFKVHLRQTPAAAVVGEGSSMMKQRLQENPTFFILMWVIFIYLFIYSSLPVSGGCLTWGRRLWGRVVWPFLFSSYMNMNLQ